MEFYHQSLLAEAGKETERLDQFQITEDPKLLKLSESSRRLGVAQEHKKFLSIGLLFQN